MAVVLSWGKPRIFVQKKVAGSALIELASGVEGSTTLNTTQGNKQEAKIEGGENEAVRYSKNTYQLVTSIRAAASRKKPVDDNDGIIDGIYCVILQPENTSALGLCIENATLSCMDTFTSTDGGTWQYNVDALTADSGAQIKWGTVAVTESSGSITSVEFTENKTSGGHDTTLSATYPSGD